MRRDARQSVDLATVDPAEPAPAGVRRRGPFRVSPRVLASPAYRRIWVSGIIYYSARWVEIITTGW
ncbi:MAG TPA: hypothetical protein VFV93_08985, partial [Thermomicrobiales bacterium]|nr:hypothetical protein [Thermomicrobiales bacterium]